MAFRPARMAPARRSRSWNWAAGSPRPSWTAYFSRPGHCQPDGHRGRGRRRRRTGRSEDADGEVMLDIEIVGALAPAAAIVVYFAPNTDSGFLDALSQAAHAAPTPVAISISWGQSEDGLDGAGAAPRSTRR